MTHHVKSILGSRKFLGLLAAINIALALAACGDGGSMSDELMNGGADGTDATGGTPVVTGGTGGTDVASSGGAGGTNTSATGGLAATGGNVATGGSVTTGGMSAGAGGTVMAGGNPGETPKPKAELTPNDFIPSNFYVLARDVADQKLKIGQDTYLGGFPGCEGYVDNSGFGPGQSKQFRGIYIRAAKVEDFGKYHNLLYEITGKFNTDYIMGYNPDYTPSQAALEIAYGTAASNPKPNGNCPGFPKE